jgi:hypothetical protein
MTANDPTPAPHAPPQTANLPPDGEMRFTRAALLSGRSLFWETEVIPHTHRVCELIRWCLALPGARMGISPRDIARILRGLYADPNDPPAPEVVQLVERFGMANRQISRWPPDDTWKPHRDRLIAWLRGASSRDDNVWLEPHDAVWWLEATKESLLSYAELFDLDVDSDIIFELVSRHRCTVFAPFDGAATWDRLDALVSEMSDQDRQDAYQRQLRQTPLTRDECAQITGTYWSWRLLDFSPADDSIIYTPLLSLWNYWPGSAEWAPLTLASSVPQTSLSGAEVTRLLDTTFWVQMESILGIAREACGLGEATSEFAAIETRPPLFFFAAPANIPLLADEYAESMRDAIAPLVSGCLLTEDPLSAQIGWGVLEGHVVTLRGEISNREFYRPRYLMFPTAAPSHRTIEQDIGFIADQLTFLEFNIGLGARSIADEMDPLNVKSALWGATLDRVANVTGDAADLLASVGRRNTATINHRLASLHLIVRRLETFIEKAASDSNQIERTLGSYVDNTDDFIRRQLTASTVPRVASINLRDALLNAYPYQYVKEPLNALQVSMQALITSVERSGGTVNTILEQSDREEREGLTHQGRWVGVVVALLALVIGLLQVLGTQSSGVGALIQQFGWLAQVTPLVVAVLGGLLFISAIVYGMLWLRQFLPKRRHRFIRDVQRFRAMVNAANSFKSAIIEAQAAVPAPTDQRFARAQAELAKRWSEFDALDDAATAQLATLWTRLQQTRDTMAQQSKGSQRTRRGVQILTPGAREWAVRAHYLEHTIELFDLVPDRILLPRALCILRFKSQDFYRRSTMSTGNFSASLRSLGFTRDEIKLLEFWLSAPENQRPIREWNVAKLAHEIKQRGVSVVPSARTPGSWQYVLEAKS